MIIQDGDDIIRRQLSATEKTKIAFDSTHFTELVPVSVSPVPDGNVLLLDGEWSVKYYPFEESEASSDADWRSWPKKQQPGKIFYADPLANSAPIPNWDGVTLAHVDERDGAIVRRETRIPAEWKGKRIVLRFDAVYPSAAFYINGICLGRHDSGLTVFEADVTDFVRPGENAVISVRLFRKHKFAQMDMLRHALEFCGISQHVRLFATEKTYLAAWHLVPELSSDFRMGTLAGYVIVRNASDGDSLCVRIRREGTVAAEQTIPLKNGRMEYPLNLTVGNPALWNDEYPNLYTTEVLLKPASGCGETRYSHRIGFRCLELSPEGPKLNGNFVKFRGVNHLTFHPEGGLYTPREWLRRDLTLMKHANVNAVRTHFCAPEDFVDLCDELGIYLLQELPIDWGTHYIHDPEWVGPALMRLHGAILRDRNHPSVMVWSVGNENMPESKAVAEDGWNHLRIYDRFCHQLDSTRPTMFPPPGPANTIKGIFELRVGDVADIHYMLALQKDFREFGKIRNPNSWEDDMVEITFDEARKRGWSGCWFSSEYGIFNAEPDLLHAPYLSLISDCDPDPLSTENTQETFYRRLKKEWGQMREDPSCLGGAYFPWLCAGAAATPEENTWGWIRWSEDANWGVVTADLLPKAQFWTLRVLFSPLWFPARVSWKTGDSAVVFTVQNQYNAIDFADCTFRINLNHGGTWMSMVRRFFDYKVAGRPGEFVKFEIPVNETMRKHLDGGGYMCCRITVLDPKGFSPLKTDVLVIPEVMQKKDERGMPIGPDAILEN